MSIYSTCPKRGDFNVIPCPSSDGLQPTSDGLQPASNSLQPTSDGLHPSSFLLLVVMASTSSFFLLALHKSADRPLGPKQPCDMCWRMFSAAHLNDSVDKIHYSGANKRYEQEHLTAHVYKDRPPTTES